MKKYEKNIRNALKSKRWNQSDLAKALNIRPTTISHAMRRPPSVEVLQKIASALDVSVGWLLGEDDNSSTQTELEMESRALLARVFLTLSEGHKLAESLDEKGLRKWLDILQHIEGTLSQAARKSKIA